MTKNEIEKLKRDWLNDPCWDIEDTEGFEEHRDELKTFRLKKESERDAEWEARLLRFAEELGVSGNVRLARKMESIFTRLTDLEEKQL